MAISHAGCDEFGSSVTNRLPRRTSMTDPRRRDRRWGEWSGRALEEAANRTVLVINPLVFAEVSIGYERVEDLESALPRDLFRREALPWAAAFLAGKCFVRYRKAGGVRTSPLPDFYIGAHAAIAGYALLTREARRYRTYFPKLDVISP